jgi:arylsulfatase
MRLSRRDFVKTAAGGMLAASGLRHSHGQTAAGPMNLVYIMTDQQPVSTLGCYGNSLSPTPNLDRLAATGIRFTNFYIGGFPCSPSRACMITGRHPHGHGVITNDVLLGEDVPSMGRVMQASGRDTGYFGKWHLGGMMYRGVPGRKPHDGRWFYRRVPDETGFRFEQVEGGIGEDQPQLGFHTWAGGWQHYHAYLRDVGLGDLVEQNPMLGNHNDLPSGPDSTHAYSRLPEEHHMAAFFAREAESFIRGHRSGDTPFALVLSFYGPHLPVAPPQPWDEKYSLDRCPLPPNHFDQLDGKPIRQRTNRRCYVLPTWTDEQFQDYIRRYYGYCAYIDKQIGRVLDALTECALDDSTIVIFTSDHGDMVGAHGFIYKLGTCGYEELSNVPFIMRVPSITQPDTATEALASNVDIMPTLTELMGLPRIEGMHGVSLAEVLARPTSAVRDRIFAHWTGSSFVTFDGTWKYALHWKQRDVDELYNLRDDPGEMRNLVAEEECADVVKANRQAIFDWLRETGHPYAHVVEEKAQETVETRLVDADPEAAEFRYLGGNEFEMTIVWHVRGPVDADQKYWCFTQFVNPKYGTDNDIVFRFTPWPDPPTTEWKPGNDYAIGPVKVRVPDHAGPGKYEVRSGLWNPETRQGPGILVNGVGNARIIGDLTIAKEGDAITDIKYAPRT